MADAKSKSLSSAERLEAALQALERHMVSGGSTTGKVQVATEEIQDFNKTELEGLRRENAILKDKHHSLKIKLDKAIHRIESVIGGTPS